MKKTKKSGNNLNRISMFNFEIKNTKNFKVL